jgi:glutaminase
LDNPKIESLEFIRAITGISGIDYRPGMAESEIRFGYRNYALVYLMKDFGSIHNDIETVLDLYFNLCSIEMT